MTGKLAIFTPQLGTASETFIRRHVEDLLPGRTVVVAGTPRRHSTAIGTRNVLFGSWIAGHDGCPCGLRVGSAFRRHDARCRAGAVSAQHGTTVILGEYLDQFADFIPLLDRMRLPYIAQGHGIDVSAALRKPGMAQRYRAYEFGGGDPDAMRIPPAATDRAWTAGRASSDQSRRRGCAGGNPRASCRGM